MTLSNNSEPCPRCGRLSKGMDGTFDFDSEGFATILNAPQWSIDALRAVQGELQEAAKALGDLAYTDERAYRLLDAKLDVIVQQNADLGAHVRALRVKLTRTRLAATLVAASLILGTVSDFGGAATVTSEVIEYLVGQIQLGVSAPQFAPGPMPSVDANVALR